MCAIDYRTVVPFAHSIHTKNHLRLTLSYGRRRQDKKLPTFSPLNNAIRAALNRMCLIFSHIVLIILFSVCIENNCAFYRFVILEIIYLFLIIKNYRIIYIIIVIIHDNAC